MLTGDTEDEDIPSSADICFFERETKNIWQQKKEEKLNIWK